jgi:hypothetical protein
MSEGTILVPQNAGQIVLTDAPTPSTPPERKREAWTQDEIKPFGRVAAIAQRHNVQLMMACLECKSMVAFGQGPGGLVMECNCKVREVI